MADRFPAVRRDWLVALALALLAHALVLGWWLLHPDQMQTEASEQLVAVEMIAPQPVPAAAPAPQPPRPQPKKQELPSPAPVAEQALQPVPPAPEPVVQQQSVAAAPTPVLAAIPKAVAAPVELDVEPDYKAAYLHNPPPVYPASARRLGLQGKVVLNVEVLAEGACGRVEVQRSSGHEMLDNTALQTVKKWRFTPARHAGQPVTRWFLVPVRFSLEES